jgi:hypothetical protein
MAREGIKDYLKDFPIPYTAKIESALIKAEIERVTNSNLPKSSLCDKYVNVDQPISNDINQWQDSINNTKVNFIVAEQRRLNLELDKQYGPTVWQEHLKQAANMQETIQI